MNTNIGFRIGAGLAGVALLAATPAALAAPAATGGRIDPTTLPRGHAPRVPVLEGNRIVTPHGVITIKKKLTTPMLMGSVGRGELLGAWAGGFQLYAVARDGRTVKRGPAYQVYDSTPMMAAGRVVIGDSDRGTGMSWLTRISATTGRAVHKLKRLAAVPLSTSARGVVFAQFNRVSLWKRDGKVVPLFTLSNDMLTPIYVDLRRNLVITDRTTSIAFSSVTHPDTVRWRMPEATPLAITPDGRDVLVLPVNPKTTNYRKAVQLRRLSDGKLLRTYRFTGTLPGVQAQFENNGAFLVAIAVPGHRQVLVRCRVSGGCVRASGRVPTAWLAERGTL